MSQRPTAHRDVIVERVQTGVRLEKHMLKVLKALADSLDITLGDLLEGIVLHAFEGKAPFSKATRAKVAELRKVFGFTLTAADAHHLKEKTGRERPAR
jgi:predicted DNA-binding ribbon-helix-helix protein